MVKLQQGVCVLKIRRLINMYIEIELLENSWNKAYNKANMISKLLDKKGIKYVCINVGD